MDKLLTSTQIAERVHISASDWRSRVSRGTAPEPDRVDSSGGQVERSRPLWRESTVEAWIAMRLIPYRKPQFRVVYLPSGDPKRGWAVVNHRSGKIVERFITDAGARRSALKWNSKS